MTRVRVSFAIAISAALMSFPAVQADQVIDFENAATGAEFSGDTAGSTAGPFDIDGTLATFTTSNVSGFVEATSFGLGVNSGGGDPDTDAFNIGESWSMRTDAPLLLVEVNIGGLQTEETFEMQSNRWINLAGVTTGTGVTYTASTGTFTLTDNGALDDVFTLDDLTGGVALGFKPGIDLTFGNLTSTFGSNDDVEIQSITFRGIPEPGSLGILALCGIGMNLRRRSKLV